MKYPKRTKLLVWKADGSFWGDAEQCSYGIFVYGPCGMPRADDHVVRDSVAKASEKMLAMLKRLEWSAQNSHGHHVLCPVCDGHEKESHVQRCCLKVLIDEAEGEKP